MAPNRTFEIAIIGGSLAGVNLVHHLLRRTFPALEKLDSTFSYHITLITPNSHFYYKIAAPRALINADLISEDKYFKSFEEAFKQYDAAKFTFVQGKAVTINTGSSIVTFQARNSQLPKDLKFDSLVVATGATYTSPLWTVDDDHERTRSAIKSMQQSLPKADTVLIAGGGPVGIETAGEIATMFLKAKITLITGGERLLPRLRPEIGAKAKKALEDLGVEVRLGVRMPDADSTIIPRPVVLSDRSSHSPDVYINATGPRKLNTGWLPNQWLDEKGSVAMEDSYFRVKTGGLKLNVYAIGDVVAGGNKTALEIDAMVPTVASAISVDLWKEEKHEVTQDRGIMGWLPFSGATEPTLKPYRPMKNTIVIPIGPNGGVGELYGWSAPAFMVKKAKSENFFMENVDPLITGHRWG